MNKEDEKILNKHGWQVECESPFEIRNEEEEAFATNSAAKMVLASLREEEEELQNKEEEKIIFLYRLYKGSYKETEFYTKRVRDEALYEYKHDPKFNAIVRITKGLFIQ